MTKLLGSSIACPHGCLPTSFYLPDLDLAVQAGWDASPQLKVGKKCWAYQLSDKKIYVAAFPLSEDEAESEAAAVMEKARQRTK